MNANLSMPADFRARAWWDDVPDCFLAEEARLVATVPWPRESAMRAGETRRAGLELLIPGPPSGGRYATLGASFTAAEPGDAGIEICVSVTAPPGATRRRFSEGLNLQSYPTVALPPDSAMAVLVGVKDGLADATQLAQGRLAVAWAARSDMASTPTAFRLVAEIVVRFLDTSMPTASDFEGIISEARRQDPGRQAAEFRRWWPGLQPPRPTVQ